MNTISATTIVSIVLEVLAKQAKMIEERTRQLFDALDVMPTVDHNGRYHAPVDGYIWLDGSVYLAGQFLPFDVESQSTGHNLSKKFKIVSGSETILNAALSGSVGKSWQENGQTVCYFYANYLSSAVLTALDKMIPDVGSRMVVPAIEGSTSKSWKWSTPKWLANMERAHGYNIDYGFIESALPSGLDMRVDFDRNKKNTRHGSWYCVFSGTEIEAEKQMVQYHYPKPMLVTND